MPQSLIQWKNKIIDDVTWEDGAYLKGQFPEFSLEDKAVAMEKGVLNVDRNVDVEMGLDYEPKPKIWRVYTRKKGKVKE